MPRFALDLDRPKFHTLVFGFNLVGLARVGLAKSGDHRPATLIIVYVTIIPIALILGRLAADRMKDRTPRIYTSSLSLGALTLNLIPDASSMMTLAMSDVIAVLTALTVMSGTAVAEMLHRLLGDRSSVGAPTRTGGAPTEPHRATERRPRPRPVPTATHRPPKNCQCPPDPEGDAVIG